ncbi:hypothetical protein ScPMuIL_017753 [Solemya velum]
MKYLASLLVLAVAVNCHKLFPCPSDFCLQWVVKKCELLCDEQEWANEEKRCDDLCYKEAVKCCQTEIRFGFIH